MGEDCWKSIGFKVVVYYLDLFAVMTCYDCIDFMI